jgi:hypothetical protein
MESIAILVRNEMEPDLNWLLGNFVIRVEYDDQTGYWLFFMNDQTILYIESSWNIIAEGRVSLASGDHGLKYGLSSPIDAIANAAILLAERKIIGASVDQFSADLAISFEGVVFLRTFNDSSGYESWQLAGPKGMLIVAQGGGNIVHWE